MKEEIKKYLESPPPIPCLGYWTNTTNGSDFDCEYDYSGIITCGECIINRPDGRDPRTGKKYKWEMKTK